MIIKIQNLKFAFRGSRNISSNVVSTSEGTAADYLVFKQTLTSNKPHDNTEKDQQRVYTEENCNWWRLAFRGSQETPGMFDEQCCMVCTGFKGKVQKN